MSEPTPTEKNLFKVMVLGTAVSFGCLGAIIASMKGFFHGDASFAFSFRTIVGFAIGAVIGWTFWKFIRSKMAKAEKPPEQ